MNEPILVFSIAISLVAAGFCLAVWGGGNYESRGDIAAKIVYGSALTLGSIFGALGCSVFLWLPKI